MLTFLSREGSLIYLEAVEFCGVSDVGEMVHVFKVPVICFSGGQHGHPAKPMSHSLLQIWNHTGACKSLKTTLLRDNSPVLQQMYLYNFVFRHIEVLIVVNNNINNLVCLLLHYSVLYPSLCQY